MKLLIFSDLHLEFSSTFSLPKDTDADVLILAGDIITFQDYGPMSQLLRGWSKPVVYVTGNHEYYTRKPMREEDEAFRRWSEEHHENMIFLRDQAINIDGVHFFGGTMWTDFDGGDRNAMDIVSSQMNDFYLIQHDNEIVFKPENAAALHEAFKDKLIAWLKEDLTGPRVVVSHHAPVIKPNSKHENSPLIPGFNSLDMVNIIKKYQPDLWIYGHTHECDDQTIGKTRVVSNQLGYPDGQGGYECDGFEEKGKVIEL